MLSVGDPLHGVEKDTAALSDLDLTVLVQMAFPLVKAPYDTKLSTNSSPETRGGNWGRSSSGPTRLYSQHLTGLRGPLAMRVQRSKHSL